MTKISRRAALVGVMTAGLAACSTAETPTPAPTGPASGPPPTPKPVPTTARPTPADTRPRWPLTGQLLKDRAAARHAAVAVKVPDNKFEHPQRGLNEADIVFVQLEGYLDADGHSGTRLVPVFHSRMPETVEPVRSIRPVDIPLLSPMDALIGNTGAAPWVTNYVKHHRAHLEGMLSYANTVGTGAYGIDRSRIYQYNGQTYYDRSVTCRPEALARQTTRFRAGPPQPYFPFASTAAEVSTADAKIATSVKVPYKGNGYLMSYSYDAKAKRYARSMPWGPHVLADGARVTTDNVLVIKAKQHYGKIFAGGGHDEPLHDIIDTKGTFWYFHGGRHVTGTWSKGAVAKPFAFTLADGSPLKMAPGRTFVELPDTKATIRIAD